MQVFMQSQLFQILLSRMGIDRGKKLSLMTFTYLKFALEPVEPNVFQIRFLVSYIVYTRSFTQV